jgi:hypothetical protein
MKTAQWIGASAALLALGACTKASTRTTQPPVATYPEPAPVTPMEVAQDEEELTATLSGRCPIEARGVSVAVESTADGAALVFTSVSDASSLRTQLFAMADTHNEMHARMGALPGTSTADRGIGLAPEQDEIARDDRSFAEEDEARVEEDRSFEEDESIAQDDPASTMEDDYRDRDDRVLAGGRGQQRTHEHGLDADTDTGQLVLTHSRARVEYVPGGAKMIYTAAPEDLTSLRSELHGLARRLEQDCQFVPSTQQRFDRSDDLGSEPGVDPGLDRDLDRGIDRGIEGDVDVEPGRDLDTETDQPVDPERGY